MKAISWIPARWPAPETIHAGVTTRSGGTSQHAYASFNLATHVGDNPIAVASNRQILREMLRLPSEPLWLNQHHGNAVINLNCRPAERMADGACTDQVGIVCAILTADCLPVLLCNRQGTEIAALHGGWRGLAGGIIKAGVACMRSSPDELLAWLGPAIGPAHYEIDLAVRAAFQPCLPEPEAVFKPTRPFHWQLNLYAAARQLLQAAGVNAIYGDEQCTYRVAEHFYSYRREGATGRMASLIWITGQEPSH